MKATNFFISTVKEAPSEAEIISHKLMMRSGMIKRLGAGIYNYMPVGLRVIRKVERIIREEMDHAGAIECLMPVIQPAELWQESGRFEKMGPELLRIKDRHDRDYIIQPTSEEVITDIARQELRSYRHLPKNFYHIQTKFRDERRPRFGLMRGREFTMKDAYSFDRDIASACKSYDKMYSAYCKIFDRFGLKYRAVSADTGAIGGDRSHEFQVIAETGEDTIVYSEGGTYAANIELAEAIALNTSRGAAKDNLTKTCTMQHSSCSDISGYLGLPQSMMVISVLLATDKFGSGDGASQTEFWLMLIRGDHTLNEVKIGKMPSFKGGFRFASTDEIRAQLGCGPDYIGPIGVEPNIKIIADRTVSNMANFVCGANEDGYYLTGVNWGRDIREPDLIADIRNVVAGDPSPDGNGILSIQRGIEVGHIFFLGTKYSAAMKATFLDEGGKPTLMEMGCYGIGVTRVLGAAIEQSHDDRGIIWPVSIAPFEAVICPIGMERSDSVRDAALSIYDALRVAGVDVLLDDRGERPGAMFADWELLGIPLRIVVSDRTLKDGEVEMQGRRENVAFRVTMADVAAETKAVLSRAS